MTALAGVWNLSGRPGTAEDCARMLGAQRIYGPDGDAVSDRGDIAIGRCLFQLLPEDVHDRGPVEGGGGRFALVGDVRLDNRDELAEALGLAPGLARTMPDAAFLMRAWERWGEGAFAHLFGDYAFALWDSVDGKLILARDHVGTRPLHYHQGNGFFAFASMPKGLHALHDIPYGPDDIRNAAFLALMAERGPRSFFAGISRVEAGQFVAVSRAGLRTGWHWQPPPRAQTSRRPPDYAEGLREHLDRAVQSRLRGAGTQVGTHLSAGLDSASVSASAARLMEAAGGSVVAFTSVPRRGFADAVAPQRLGDEGDLAGATAAMYPNIEHVRVHSDGIPVLDDLDRDFYLFERPLANAEVQHWWKQINAEARRRGIRVMLTGAGGNATLSFTGLPYLPELARRGRLIELLRVARRLVANKDLRWRGALIQAFGPWMPVPVWVALNTMRTGMRLELDSYSMLKPERLAEVIADAACHDDFDPSYRPKSDATRMQRWMLGRVDFGNNQKGALAGWGVDMRDPTTDRRLAEYCMSIPVSAFLEGGRLRGLARAALAGRLPADVLNERRKGYQSVDWYESFTAQQERVRSEVARLGHVVPASETLDTDRMRRFADTWPTEGWTTPRVETQYRYALLRGLVSGHFLRKSSRSNA